MNKKEKIINLLESGLTYNEIIKHFKDNNESVSKSTISFHAKRNNIIRTLESNLTIDSFDWVEIQKYYDICKCYKKTKSKFGISDKNWKEAQDKKLILTKRRIKITKNNFIEYISALRNRKTIKKYILKFTDMKYECDICKLITWNDKEISLQLDHINGVNDDNRLENLRLLCPNCHSQTDTYAGKNLNNKNRKRKSNYKKIDTDIV